MERLLSLLLTYSNLVVTWNGVCLLSIYTTTHLDSASIITLQLNSDGNKFCLALFARNMYRMIDIVEFMVDIYIITWGWGMWSLKTKMWTLQGIPTFKYLQLQLNEWQIYLTCVGNNEYVVWFVREGRTAKAIEPGKSGGVSKMETIQVRNWNQDR